MCAQEQVLYTRKKPFSISRKPMPLGLKGSSNLEVIVLEQWKRFKELEQPLGNAPKPDNKDTSSPALYDQCVSELVGTNTAVGLLAFRGVPAGDTSDEIAPLAIPAAFAAFEALF